MIRQNTGNLSIGMNDGTKTKVYDAVAKLLLGEFESNRDASNFLGVSIRTLRDAKNRKSVIQPKTNKLNKRIAVR